jgi:hypothetical protein
MASILADAARSHHPSHALYERWCYGRRRTDAATTHHETRLQLVVLLACLQLRRGDGRGAADAAALEAVGTAELELPCTRRLCQLHEVVAARKFCDMNRKMRG